MPSDSTKGFALIACSIVLLSLSLELMQNHDDAEREYESECALQHRAMDNNFSTPDWGRCSELDDTRSRKATSFMVSLAAFVLSGLMGTVMLLPGDENQR